MESKPLPILSAEDLFAYRTTPQLLPRREPKDSPRAVNSLPSVYLEEKALLKEERVEALGSLARAEYDPTTNRIELAKPQGKFWQSMGYVDNGKLMLYPEEVIFLMDTSRLEVYQCKVPLSIQEAYKKLLNDDCPIEQYQTYAHLSRLGYIVVRHQGSFNVTPYERQIGLRSHLYKNQTRTDSKSKLEKIADENVTASTSSSSHGNEVINIDDSPDRKKKKLGLEPVLIVLDDEDSNDAAKRKPTSSTQNSLSKSVVKTPPVPFPNMAGVTVLYLDVPHPSLLPPNVKVTDEMCTVDITKLHMPTNIRSAHHLRNRGHWSQRRGEWRGGRGAQRQRSQYDDRRQCWTRHQEDSNATSTSYQRRDSSPYRGGRSSQYSGRDCSTSRSRDSSPFRESHSSPYRQSHSSPYRERDRSPYHKFDISPSRGSFHSSDGNEKSWVASPHTNISDNFNRNEFRWDGSSHTKNYQEFSQREPTWEGVQQNTNYQNISRNDVRWSSAQTHELHQLSGTERLTGLVNSRSFRNNGSEQSLSSLALTNIFHSSIPNEQRWVSSANASHSNNCRQSCDSIGYQDSNLRGQIWSCFPPNPSLMQPTWDFPSSRNRDEVWEGLPSTTGCVSNNENQRLEHNLTQTDSMHKQRWDHSPNRKNFQVKDRREITSNEASCTTSKDRDWQRWDSSPRDRYQGNGWRKGHCPRQQTKNFVKGREKSSSQTRSPSKDSTALKQNVDSLDCSSWREYKQHLASHQDIEGLKSGPAGCLWNGAVMPLVQPKDAVSSARVLETLRTVKHLSLTTLPTPRFVHSNPGLKITYDVYLPNSGFVKTKPVFPNHRVIVTRIEDPFPSLADIGAPIASLTDGVPLHFAVVDNGNVSFFSLNDVSLPLQSGVG